MSINNDLESFQNGVDTIVSGCTTYGSTPTASTPSAIITAIKNIYDSRYNSGRTQGQNDVKNNPGGYGLYTKGNENTPASASAANITKGYTAWVNGTLIIGTRPSPVTQLSGSIFSGMFAWGTVTKTVVFEKAFDVVPKVTYSIESDMVGGRIENITKSGFNVVFVHQHTGTGSGGTCHWVASAS